VSGVTSNRTIFDKAVSGSTDYDEVLVRLVGLGAQRDDMLWELMLEDIRNAADVFRPVYEQTEGAEGLSIEVSPRLVLYYDEMVRPFLRWLDGKGVRRFDDLNVGLMRTYRAQLAARPSQYGRPLQPKTILESHRAILCCRVLSASNAPWRSSRKCWYPDSIGECRLNGLGAPPAPTVTRPFTLTIMATS
jgi:transaldolase/fructose-6-phosphate aldolase-like protein